MVDEFGVTLKGDQRPRVGFSRERAVLRGRSIFSMGLPWLLLFLFGMRYIERIVYSNISQQIQHTWLESFSAFIH